MEFKHIKGSDIGKDPTQQFLILDVRTVAEHDEKRLVTPHILIPHDQLDAEDFINKINLAEGVEICC